MREKKMDAKKYVKWFKHRGGGKGEGGKGEGKGGNEEGKNTEEQKAERKRRHQEKKIGTEGLQKRGD